MVFLSDIVISIFLFPAQLRRNPAPARNFADAVLCGAASRARGMRSARAKLAGLVQEADELISGQTAGGPQNEAEKQGSASWGPESNLPTAPA